jgi:N-acetylglucosamine kinase-like BadF-type ATPase
VTLDELVRWAAVANPAQVASLAAAVLEVAADGDRVAQGIADYAARELSQLAICLLPQLDPGDTPMPTAITGGLLGTDRPLRRVVLAKLAEEPKLQVIESPIDAAAGAVALGGQAGRPSAGQ